MKRNLLVVAATSSILALAAPPLALAQGRHHHHSARHASAHKRAHRAHVLTFGGRLSGSPSSTAPTTGTPSSGEPAGTVVSFTEGVLTIELTSDKSLIKGKVTERTELECQPAAGAGSDEEQGGGDDQDRSASGDEGGPSSQTQASGQNVAMARSSDVGDDQGEEQDEEETCTRAALKPGAVVLRAELLIGGSGAVWEKIELQE
jgi:hypothetical protein